MRGDTAQLAAAATLPQVERRLPFTNADKLAPALLRALARGDTTVGKLRIIGWPGDSGELQRDLRVVAISATAPASAGTLLRIAALPTVRWIEPVGRPRLLNDQARTIMHVDPVWQSQRLFGAGQIVAVADSGLDTGNLATIARISRAGSSPRMSCLRAAISRISSATARTSPDRWWVPARSRAQTRPRTSTPARSPASHPRPNWLSRRLRPGRRLDHRPAAGCQLRLALQPGLRRWRTDPHQ